MLRRLKSWLNNPRGTYNERQERTIESLVNQKVSETVENMRASAPISMLADQKDVGWRRLTADHTRDLDPMSRYQMIRVAEYLAVANPLAKWILDLSKDFVCGKGFTISSDNEEVKTWLDDFWTDPAHNLDLNIGRHAKNLSQYGELCLPAFVNEYTGRVKLGFIDPMVIEDVIADPGNALVAIGVVLIGRIDGKQVKLKTILPGADEDTLSPDAIALRETFTDGQCFYAAINQPGASCRGISDFFALADWMDGYDQYMWANMERADHLNKYVWDVELTGADDKAIDAWLAKNGDPRSGSMFAHNEKLKMSAVSPDLKAVDNAEQTRIFRNHIMGGANMPEHWYGGGGNVNKATASEMDTPTMTHFASRQGDLINLTYQVLDFVIEQGISHKMVADSEDAYTYKVETPELATKDIAKISTALQQITTSLTLAKSSRFIDSKNASRTFCNFLSQIGTDVDADEAYAAAQGEAVTDSYQDYRNPSNTVPPPQPQNPLKGAIARKGARRPSRRVYKRL
jgi:hypothetical protein